MTPYEIRQCSASHCLFRFPVAVGNPAGSTCPHCGETTVFAVAPGENVSPSLPQAPPRFKKLELLLDNIRSLYNVGTIIRTADGAGVKHLHLGGITAPPTHPKLVKTALGAETAVPWTQHHNSVHATNRLKAAGYKIWVLEETSNVENLFGAELADAKDHPILLVIGNEKVGVDPDILALADRTFALPMHGVKNSLNVAVAFGIAVYQIQFGQKST